MHNPKVLTQVRAVLPAGETYVAAVPVIGGLRALPWLPKFNLYIPWKYRVIAVTDQNIHVYTAAWFSICKPKKLIMTLPPGTILAAKSYHLQFNKTLWLGDEEYWVHFAQCKNLAAVVQASIEAASNVASPGARQF